MSSGIQIDKRTWREARGDNWSETLYSGLYLHDVGRAFLISKLSHGLRVMEVKNHDKYKFESISASTSISSRFVMAIRTAFTADMEFQCHLGNYEELMSKL